MHFDFSNETSNSDDVDMTTSEDHNTNDHNDIVSSYSSNQAVPFYETRTNASSQ